MTLKEKLHQIYEAVDHIEKLGHNKAQNYDFIRAADVTNTIRKQLRELKVYAEINFQFIGEPYTIARKSEKDAPFSAVNVRCSVIFHDLESNEFFTSSGLGSGADTGDKAAYKAQTGALKYALKNAFLVPDEADPEADESVDYDSRSDRSNPPDFQEARHTAPKPAPAPRAQKSEERPTQASETQGEAPRSEPSRTAASSTQSTASTSPAQPADAPETISDAQGVSDEPPTEEELAGYRTKFKKLGDDLADKGKLKASKSLPANRKLLMFLLSITGATEAPKITKAQWEDFFKRVDHVQGLENGLVGLAKLVNKANGIESDEKKK